MTRLPIALALATTVGLAQQTPRSPAGEQRVHLLIDAVAVDRNGNPVMDLRREEVEVWISRYRVPFQRFTAVNATESNGSDRMIVLVLDDVTIPPVLLSRVREVARRFVNRMAPGDRMAIVTLNGSTMESTDDGRGLLRSIERYNPQATGVIPLDALSAHVLKTIASLSRQLAEGPGRRRTIVGIGSAWLFNTPIPPPTVARDLRQEWTDAVRAMAMANANLYVIDPGGVGTSPTFSGTTGFAHENGGHAFLNTNDLNGAADRIMREAANYYLIDVIDPPVQRKADLRELNVRVLRSGITVRARRAIPGTQ